MSQRIRGFKSLTKGVSNLHTGTCERPFLFQNPYLKGVKLISKLPVVSPTSEEKKQKPKRTKYIRKISDVEQLSDQEQEALAPVSEKYVFRANDYYIKLINWDDPNDPIRNLIIPNSNELKDWGKLDASNEEAVTVVPGVQHKYTDTVLLLCNEVCGAYCRYCFRKRLFMDDNDEVSNDISAGLEYIANHPEVTNVLLTGGDPLLMSTRRLKEIFAKLREIPHVKIIRIGSKMPAFDPYRVLNDEELQAAFREFSTPEKRIYLMAHFDHPVELTDVAVEGINAFIRNGVICINQCPLIKGVNDNADVLSELYAKLSYIGCTPYYLFQGRPTEGNEPFELPIVEGARIFQKAISQGSGLSRRIKFSMSHETGKIEIVGFDDSKIYLRYHQAKNPADLGRFIICKRDDNAYWFDQLEILDEHRLF